jgi:GNAT superfamily N-acetyltransferase
VQIVVAGPADVADLALLLWSHAAPGEQESQTLESFTDDLSGWWSDHSGSHRAFLARLEGTTVGAGWLAITARPPRPGAVDRRSADVQSVFVDDDHRGRGVGAALVRAMTDHAWRCGVQRVTVHSSSRAVPLYERGGFRAARELLQVTAPHAASPERR